MEEKIKIKTSGGKNISAVIHRPKIATEKLAILCPGFLDSKDYNHLIYLANDLTVLGYTVVRFDPTGTWESEGDISDYTTTQQLEDVKNIIEHLLQERSYTKILLGGHSRGGFVSILYAIRDPRVSTVLAIMSPYSLIRTVNKEKIEKWKEDGFKVSVRDIPNSQVKRKFKVSYSDIEDGEQYNILNEIERLHTPLILVAGELDDVIPPEDVRLIYDKANEPKQLIVLEGIDHDYRHDVGEIEKVNKQILASEYI